jgi:hypothetical protein
VGDAAAFPLIFLRARGEVFHHGRFFGSAFGWWGFDHTDRAKGGVDGSPLDAQPSGSAIAQLSTSGYDQKNVNTFPKVGVVASVASRGRWGVGFFFFFFFFLVADNINNPQPPTPPQKKYFSRRRVRARAVYPPAQGAPKFRVPGNLVRSFGVCAKKFDRLPMRPTSIARHLKNELFFFFEQPERHWPIDLVGPTNRC